MEAIVQTRCGRVRGTTAANGVCAFLGISYAAPPVGANRLRPAQPVEPWTGIRDATVIGPEPPQPQFGMDDVSGLLFDPAVMGDDCLNLNIWTPDLGAVGLPVMVFSPGGAFRFNSGGSYDGSRFARDGVVLVTINWRTGADGFLYLGGGDAGANLGLLDQVVALTWVRENIAAFGGDPGRVTVFGESAGAMSIGDLLSMPAAEGLFRRAVLESGAAHHVMPADEAARIGARLAEVLGVAATREAIAEVPVARLLEAQARIDAELMASPDPACWGAEVVASVMPFHPVVDGDVLPAVPIDRIGAGASAHVDVLVGTNADDWRYSPVLGGFIDQITEDILAGPAETYGFWSIAAYGLDAESVLPHYRAATRFGNAPGEALAAVMTDWWVRVPAMRLADAHAPAPGGTFMYEFAWPSPIMGGRLGSCHALEMPFAFDTLDLRHRQMMGGALGQDPPQELANTMHRAWVDFASTGEPGWPRYDLDRRAVMRFNLTSSMVEDPYARERALWAGVR
jgi:para-nitrobenzyl esterase